MYDKPTVKFYEVKGKTGNHQKFNIFYNRREKNLGVSVVILYRIKRADIQYDWDDGVDGLEDYKIKHDLNEHKINSEIFLAAMEYVPKRKIHNYVSCGKIYDIPFDENIELSKAHQLAREICSIYEKYLI